MEGQYDLVPIPSPPVPMVDVEAMIDALPARERRNPTIAREEQRGGETCRDEMRFLLLPWRRFGLQATAQNHCYRRFFHFSNDRVHMRVCAHDNRLAVLTFVCAAIIVVEHDRDSRVGAST